MLNTHGNNIMKKIMLRKILVSEKELSDLNFERLKKHRYTYK